MPAESVTSPVSSPVSSPGWTFLTNHTHVLICIAEDTSVRERDIAAAFGEQAVEQAIRRNGFFVPEVLAGLLFVIELVAGINRQAVASEPHEVVIRDDDKLLREPLGCRVMGDQRRDQLD